MTTAPMSMRAPASATTVLISGAAPPEHDPRRKYPRSRPKADIDPAGEIADGDLPIERHDPPEPERLAGRQVEAQAAEPGDAGDRYHRHAAGRHDRGCSPTLNGRFLSGRGVRDL
ncbi:hypothetical protein [Bradyrhizobium japonicum]|uniref:hypothetical protein n=1 Tax=Bradyrhizobium japonicum TaxID=375 RepID=UPI0035C8E4F4|nr:hypothetical protein [Bradyrhizobium japonicum]MCP1966183.1 hypothetical protein [Bradyrhizobium japonicum]